MTFENPKKWLLVISQIPLRPNALCVKICRRLQQMKDAAINPVKTHTLYAGCQLKVTRSEP